MKQLCPHARQDRCRLEAASADAAWIGQRPTLTDDTDDAIKQVLGCRTLNEAATAALNTRCWHGVPLECSAAHELAMAVARHGLWKGERLGSDGRTHAFLPPSRDRRTQGRRRSLKAGGGHSRSADSERADSVTQTCRKRCKGAANLLHLYLGETSRADWVRESARWRSRSGNPCHVRSMLSPSCRPSCQAFVQHALPVVDVRTCITSRCAGFAFPPQECRHVCSASFALSLACARRHARSPSAARVATVALVHFSIALSMTNITTRPILTTNAPPASRVPTETTSATIIRHTPERDRLQVP